MSLKVRVTFAKQSKPEKDNVMAKYIKVKAAEGRVARDGPNGRYIPADKFMEVQETAYIRRLIDVHGDLIEETAASSAPKPSTLQPIPPVAQPTS